MHRHLQCAVAAIRSCMLLQASDVRALLTSICAPLHQGLGLQKEVSLVLPGALHHITLAASCEESALLLRCPDY